MSRMTAPDWATYAILRDIKGKAYAEDYRHKRNKRNAELGIGLRHTRDEFILVSADSDSMRTKKFIYGELSDADLLAIEHDEWINVQPSAYDCTGQAFTRWIQFFKVPHGYWMYHFIGYDV